MKRITIQQMIALNPCEDYTLERLTELWAGRESLAALEILDLEIPSKDKLWAVLKNWCFDDRTLHHLAADFAEKVLPIFEATLPDDNRPRLAIQATRDLADGKITAASAASDAYSAAASAAYSVANFAAHSATHIVAHIVARDTSAAHSAKQIAHIRKILADHGGVYPQVPVKQVCVKGET